MDKTLLQKALKSGSRVGRTTTISPDHIELALAWARDEIGITQVAIALGYAPTSIHTAYIPLARALKIHLRSKKK